ncbi:hypothetical protein [Lacipirellula parvula]|uniref:Carboxypeptidase regulatory-like domain-containing protein n=1 Tax=Lacipirellula parvula TaxID=2650471 RepID=A0A5K7XMQ5_9BACT|nr:hypothetical protein [Lacipirellula parvula]BBO34379.1 hypothetical protein PLANPX_3991 [Lacipirellula parvula]
MLAPSTLSHSLAVVPFALFGGLGVLTSGSLTNSRSSIEQTRYAVAGSILIDGAPAEGAVVSLHPVAPLRWAYVAPRTTVRADGTFEINTTRITEGADASLYALTIESPRVPARYRRPDASPLQLRVADGPYQLPPINIGADGGRL